MIYTLIIYTMENNNSCNFTCEDKLAEVQYV